MELRFVEVESTFDYFASTAAYLKRHGKPVALYSDKHSIFRLYHQGATGRAKGLTQFGRALSDLNIDIICANTPQAKGRVERMNQTPFPAHCPAQPSVARHALRLSRTGHFYLAETPTFLRRR